MNKRIMAVYDVDPFYAERFSEFINQKESTPFMAIAFTSLARLKAFAQRQQIEILLVGDEVEERELTELGIHQIVRLSEAAMVRSGTPAVYKYQASDSILREVMACYQTEEKEEQMTAVGARSRVIGVYSPIGRCGKTGFSVTLGQVLSRDSKVLFLSLEEFAGFSQMMGTKYSGSFSDLVYYSRQGDFDRMRLGSVIYDYGGLDYVPPVAYAEDLAQMEGAEVAGLLEKIARECGYDVLIVDVGHFLRNVEAVLAVCDVVYAPIRKDVVSETKIQQWRQYLEDSGRMNLWEKIRILRLPLPSDCVSAGEYFEQLLWGPVGDFVREMTGRSEKGMQD
ncbi:hypothetical protein [Brotaphodocola sp.]|uniref:hypothetical protein n=1 Tax=Brotaphodocola sp. TaxID=3073577 RepID=UPI003D7D1305